MAPFILRVLGHELLEQREGLRGVAITAGFGSLDVQALHAAS